MSTVDPLPVPPAGAEVRPMRPDDVERVAEIEREAFTSPWKAETFRRLMGRPGAELLTLELPPHGVVGYAVLWCIEDQGELANIGIDAAHRRRGLGSLLLDRVIGLARERGVKSLYLEVRESNRTARHMYAERGFEEIGVRRNYYDEPREDARVLLKRLDD